jgi:hypothetical protein
MNLLPSAEDMDEENTRALEKARTAAFGFMTADHQHRASDPPTRENVTYENVTVSDNDTVARESLPDTTSSTTT